MPFHNSRHQHSQSAHDNYYSPVNAIFSAGQTLGSVGVPANQWAPPKNPPGAFPDNSPYHQEKSPENGMVIPYRSGPAAYSGQVPNSNEPISQFQTPQRSHTIGRPAGELHLPQSSSAMSDVHHYGQPPVYGGENMPLHLQSAAPQPPNSAPGHPLPNTLQPGSGNRPTVLSSANTAPTIPTLPQISTQMQQPSLSTRPTALTHSHSYSRSSPGGMDQSKYKPFSNTPEQSRLSAVTSPYGSQTPQGPSSYSPLGLADIRSRGDPTTIDTSFSPIAAQDEDQAQYASNSAYLAPWPIYAVDWCKWPPRAGAQSAGKVAIGSYLEDNHNYIQVLDAQRSQSDPDNSEKGLEFFKTAEATHAYPVTRILWEPPSSNKQTTDLLATSGDHLRLWSLPNEPQSYSSSSITRSISSSNIPLQKLSPLALLSNSKSPEHTAPITSLDWNVVQPSLIITSSIDTTCTIWDIPTLTAKTQLIAHDKEVYDVRFCANSVDVFVSCGADGSVRMFDLRSLEHSTIIYEPSEKSDKSTQLSSPDPSSSSPTRGPSSSNTNATSPFPPPLLRIAASPHDAHLLATFSQDSNLIRVLDVRQPGQALLELKGHGANVNCIEWSSTQRGVLASGADDCCVLLWDLMGSSATGGNVANTTGGSGQERGPSASWECGFEVSNLSWAPNVNVLGVCSGRGFWGVSL